MARFRQAVPRPSEMVYLAGNCMESGTFVTPRDQDAFLKSSEAVGGDGTTRYTAGSPATEP